MSYTPIQNRFWADGWVRQLNALDRYLFLYLLTNGRASLTGIYELPLDLMASESGIDEKDLRLSMLQRLEPKIYYREGWVIIKNYPKHRVSNSPKLLSGIRRSFDELPKQIQEIALSYGYPIDTLSIPIGVSFKRREENRIDLGKADALQEITLEEDTDKEPRAKQKPKYPHSREVFSWFLRPEESWAMNTTELKHAELLYARGEKKVRSILSYVSRNKKDEYFPKITKPSDLERKWEDIADYANKHD